MTPAIRLAVAALLALLAGAPHAAGQNLLPQAASKAGPPAETLAPADPLGRQTPAGAVMGFLAASARGDWPRAAKYLDTKAPQEEAEALARKLKVLLDRGLKIDLSRLSRAPEGEQDERSGRNRELVGSISTKSGTLDVVLARVRFGEQAPIWLFAPETLRGIPAAHEEYQPSSIERFLPEYITRGYGVRYQWWSWLVIVAAVAGALLAAAALARLLRLLAHGALRLVAPRVEWARWAPMFGAVRWLLFGILLLAASGFFLSVNQRYLGGRVAWLFIIASIALLAVRFLGCFVGRWTGRLEHRGATERIALVRLGGRLLQAVAIVAGGLALLQSVGINLTPVLAGLGVGGIAVALASQKTLENLFGGMMVIGDSPIKIGQFCRVGAMTGTVEDIGLRSTRIRTLGRTVISIPNADLAVQSIENFAARDKILFNHTLTLRYETTADQLRFLLAQSRELLYRHPMIESDAARVRLVRFAPSGIDVELFAYVRATQIEDFLPIQEDLLLRLMDVIEAAGTALAFPSQTAYFTRDAGIDAGKADAAAAAVREWRERGELPFPDIRPDRKRELRDGIEYPPPGSVLRKG